MKLAELIMTEARERGLRHFFGLPGGGAPLAMMEFGQQLGVDFVSCAHESSAAITAAYYGRFKDTAGLALGIKGVGAGNMVGGAANAHFERMPVVCCCESVPTSVTQRHLVGICPHEELFGGVVKYRATLNPREAPTMLQEASFQATDGRPGPVLVDLPADLGLADCAGPLPAKEPRAERPAADEDITRARQLVRTSDDQRPLVIAGADVLRARATRELQALVEAIGGAVLVEMDAHGVYPESNSRWAGTFIGAYLAHLLETEFIAQADLALLIGCDSLVSDTAWKIDMPTCELTARAEYESLAVRPDLRINGNLRDMLADMTSGQRQRGFAKEDVRATRDAIVRRNFRRPPEARFAIQDIIQIMRDQMPDSGVLISETGIFILSIHNLWISDDPGTHFGTSGGRTMGLMIPAILGAKLARPEVPMMGLGADGSTLMRLGELEVFARTGVTVPLVIVNDDALGTMKNRQKASGMPDYGLDLQRVDFAGVAQACGLYGACVETPEAFETALKASLVADRTTVIDARVDPAPYQDSFAWTLGLDV